MPTASWARDTDQRAAARVRRRQAPNASRLRREPRNANRKRDSHHDYGSPFSYLADRRLPAIAQRVGATIIYTPVSLGAVLKATGNHPSLDTVPAKGRYMSAELNRWAARYGCPPPSHSHFPINTMKLMRGAVASRHLGVFDRYHATIFDAFWMKDLSLGDDAIFANVLESAGLPAPAILAAIETPAVKDELRVNTDDAVARGMFGAPTFFVCGEMFWGNDRLDWVEEALNKERLISNG